MPLATSRGVTGWEPVKERNWGKKGKEIVPEVGKGRDTTYSPPLTPGGNSSPPRRGIISANFVPTGYLAFLFSKDTPLSRHVGLKEHSTALTNECSGGGKQAGKNCRKGEKVMHITTKTAILDHLKEAAYMLQGVSAKSLAEVRASEEIDSIIDHIKALPARGYSIKG